MAKRFYGFGPILDPDFDELGEQPLADWVDWEKRRKKAPVATKTMSPPGAKEVY